MDGTPLVCVIIPSRNEAKSIRTCLDAVIAQDYPKDRFQVLVVDGVSTDGTCEILAEYECKYPFFGVVESPRKVVSPGFNLAVSQTQADIIVRVDGHTVIAADYVSKCVEHLQRSGAENVGGKMYAVSKTPFGQAVAYATSTPFGVGGSRFHYSDKEEWVDLVYLGPGRARFLWITGCLMRNWCATRMTSLTTGCVKTAARSCSHRRSIRNIRCAAMQSPWRSSTAAMVSGRCVCCRNIRCR